MNKKQYFEYVHRDLGQTVTAIGGHYHFDREAQLAFRGRPVLYLSGYALYDSTCCGAGGCGYALVQGFVEKWKYRNDSEGFPISRVEELDEGVPEAVLVLGRDQVRRRLGPRRWHLGLCKTGLPKSPSLAQCSCRRIVGHFFGIALLSGFTAGCRQIFRRHAC